jgi:hypothetical protein
MRTLLLISAVPWHPESFDVAIEAGGMGSSKPHKRVESSVSGSFGPVHGLTCPHRVGSQIHLPRVYWCGIVLPRLALRRGSSAHSGAG